ncbi:fimbria/pilus outer membrane usher protein [Burkholderia ubonensis]|uniref:fimbria/pilus outer membrane usher protein n=1 Tax=Burkholderia ubonensis TaxID=101571 RepID=UPI0021162ADD|nr:fimbria/pilus outer membrane usher protein [Burkholderia ubonensis]
MKRVICPSDIKQQVRDTRGRGLLTSKALFPGVVVLWVSVNCSAAQLPPDESLQPERDPQNAGVDFDIETMRARGLDPALARYFAEKPRFMAGVHRVSLSVNGEPRGTIDIRFDAHGNVCFDRRLIMRARLRLPDALTPPHRWSLLDFVNGRDGSLPSLAATSPDDLQAANSGSHEEPDLLMQDGCYDYRSFQPQTEVKADASRDSVEIVVPADSLTRPRPGDGASSGGVGAMLNYNLMVSGSRSSGSGTSTFFYADAETGFNVNDWIVRSEQSYWREQGGSDFQMPYVYAQKTFVDSGYLVQVGQIAINNPVVGGTPIEGVQIVPDDALIDSGGGNGIEGVATQQSRVEVRQAGILIYSTLVPAGPFLLRGVKPVDNSSLIEVALIDDANSRRTFTVSPASLVASRTAPPGLSLAIGRVYQYRAPDGMARPVVLSVAKGWNVGKRSSLSAGAVLSSRNQAIGVSQGTPLFGNALSISSNLQVSHSPSLGERGASVGMSLSAQLPREVSLNLQANRQTVGFRSLSDTLYDIPENVRQSPYWGIMRNYRVRDYVSGSVSLNDSFAGALSASFNRFSTYSGFHGQHVAASWNRQFGRVSLSVNLDRSLAKGTTGADTTIYASLSFPLGRVNMNTYVTRNSGRWRGGINASQTINDFSGYNIGVERGQDSGSERAFGTLSLKPRYTQASLSAAAQKGSGSFSGQLQGGVVATKEGVSLSPYAIGDTFGIVSAGNLSGVSINTPAGVVWTDARGKAVIGSIPAYSEVSTVVRTKSLPRNVDVVNGYADINAGRGAVSFIDIAVRKMKRMLLDVRMGDGKPLPMGSSIRDTKDNYITTAVDDGVVYLEKDPDGPLVARLPESGQCTLQFQAPEASDTDSLFMHVSATCRADASSS